MSGNGVTQSGIGELEKLENLKLDSGCRVEKVDAEWNAEWKWETSWTYDRVDSYELWLNVRHATHLCHINK